MGDRAGKGEAANAATSGRLLTRSCQQHQPQAGGKPDGFTTVERRWHPSRASPLASAYPSGRFGGSRLRDMRVTIGSMNSFMDGGNSMFSPEIAVAASSMAMRV